MQISARLKKITKRAGVHHVTLHQFRHTCASDLLSEGIGILHIQHILGHRAIANTYRYAHVCDPEKKKAMAKHPINKVLSAINQGV
jgi:site-specific recombinase XerD